MATLSPQISLPVGTSAMVANISLIWTNSGTVMYPIDPLGVIQGENMGIHRKGLRTGGLVPLPRLLIFSTNNSISSYADVSA